MSTNVYLVRKANNIALRKMKRYQRNGNSRKLQDVCDELSKGIHIGKHMCGWKFLCDYNHGKYYEMSSDSLLEFLHKTLMSGNWMIHTDNCVGFPDGGEEAYEYVRSLIEDAKTERNSNTLVYGSSTPSSTYKIVDSIEFKDSNCEWF